MTSRHAIASLQHPFVKHLVKLRTNSDYRYQRQSIVIEGIKPIQEFEGFIKQLIYVDNKPFPSLVADEEWSVNEAIMKKISGMSAPEGLVAEVEMPAFSSLKGLKFVLALDGVNDPGNMGTLLRTALALGWEGVYLLPNSCDPYNEKTLRSARGAHFRLPLARGTADELKLLVEENRLQPFVADLKGQSPDQALRRDGCLLVVGNEARGASSDVLTFCSPLTIAMPGQMESLNVAVAGGILMYELKKTSH